MESIFDQEELYAMYRLARHNKLSKYINKLWVEIVAYRKAHALFLDYTDKIYLFVSAPRPILWGAIPIKYSPWASSFGRKSINIYPGEVAVTLWKHYSHLHRWYNKMLDEKYN